MMLRLAQNSAKCVIVIDQPFRFCKSAGLVLGTCAGTLTTATACSEFPKNFGFVCCEKDHTCFQYALPSLVEIYFRRKL